MFQSLIACLTFSSSKDQKNIFEYFWISKHIVCVFFCEENNKLFNIFFSKLHKKNIFRPFWPSANHPRKKKKFSLTSSLWKMFSSGHP